MEWTGMWHNAGKRLEPELVCLDCPIDPHRDVLDDSRADRTAPTAARTITAGSWL